jgi:hypothetical protein
MAKVLLVFTIYSACLFTLVTNVSFAVFLAASEKGLGVIRMSALLTRADLWNLVGFSADEYSERSLGLGT